MRNNSLFEIFTEAYSEPSQTPKLELFAKIFRLMALHHFGEIYIILIFYLNSISLYLLPRNNQCQHVYEEL